MKRMIPLFVCAVTAAVCCAEGTNEYEGLTVTARRKDGTVVPVKYNRDAARRAKYKITGGQIEKPGTKKGSLVYVNCQKTAPAEWLKTNADTFAKFTKLPVAVADGTFELPSPKVVGSASLFVVDDEKLPTILAAPENRWAMVNIAFLKKGEGEKPAFFAARVQKELTRGFALLCGSQDSNYPKSLMGCVTDPAQLDEFIDCVLPVDVMERLTKYVVGYGVTPAVFKTYRDAVREGWAPQPTNDVQKAIWEKINAVPDKPIKIKYDPKRDK